MKSLPSIADLAAAPARDLFAGQRPPLPVTPPCFRLARIVAGTNGYAGSCQVAVWQIRFLDLQYHATLGAQRVSPSPRLQQLFYAASELGGDYAVNHLVGVVPGTDGRYWIVVDYGTCPVSPGSGGGDATCQEIPDCTVFSLAIDTDPGCADFYGITFNLSHSSGCLWVADENPDVTLEYSEAYPGPGWIVRAGTEAVWTCPAADFGAAGGAFYIFSSDYACGSFGASLSVTGVGC